MVTVPMYSRRMDDAPRGIQREGDQLTFSTTHRTLLLLLAAAVTASCSLSYVT